MVDNKTLMLSEREFTEHIEGKLGKYDRPLIQHMQLSTRGADILPPRFITRNLTY